MVDVSSAPVLIPDLAPGDSKARFESPSMGPEETILSVSRHGVQIYEVPGRGRCVEICWSTLWWQRQLCWSHWCFQLVRNVASVALTARALPDVEVSSGKLLKSFPHNVHVNYASMRDWEGNDAQALRTTGYGRLVSPSWLTPNSSHIDQREIHINKRSLIYHKQPRLPVPQIYTIFKELTNRCWSCANVFESSSRFAHMKSPPILENTQPTDFWKYFSSVIWIGGVLCSRQLALLQVFLVTVDL